MDSRKTIVIIDIDAKRTEKTFYKLKQANVKVRVAKERSTIDEIVRNGGVRALLIAPQVANDVEKLKELYKVPVFIVGNVEVHQLPSLHKKDITDHFSSDFPVQLLFDKLGEVFIPTTNSQRQSSIFHEEDSRLEEEETLTVGQRRSKTRVKNTKDNKRVIPMVDEIEEIEEDEDENEYYEGVGVKKKKQSWLSKLNQPITLRKKRG